MTEQNDTPKGGCMKIWVIETLCDDGRWTPCADAKVTRKESRDSIKHLWKKFNPHDKFRVRAYVPERKKK